VYDTKEILEHLSMTKEELVDLCIASGTDYFPQGIPRMGPAKSLVYLKKYGNIENWTCIAVPENLNVQNIRDIFFTDPCSEDTILFNNLEQSNPHSDDDIKKFFKELV
jgi:5'-3' exonuclease